MIKKNILFINGHLDVGGCERSLVDVLKNIDYSKYNVDLLLLEHKGDYIEEVPKEVEVKLYSLDDAFGPLLSSLSKAVKQKDWFSFFFRIEYVLSKKVNHFFYKGIKMLFKDLKKSYDVIIAYRPGICTDLAAFSFCAKKKISWWHHGEINVADKEADNLNKAYKKMDVVVAVSKSSFDMLTEKFSDVKEKIIVIPNMIIPSELIQKSRECKIEAYGKAKLKIVSVGRLSPEKNMILCPQIAVELKKRGFDFKWIVVGDGEEREKISYMVKGYGLEQNVLLVGRKSNPYSYIAEADIMVHPSLVESQGITILESMALGTPVIVVRSSGPREFIISGENGYLVDSNIDDIIEKIQVLYSDYERTKRIVDCAKKTMYQFEPEQIMKNIDSIMKQE